MDGILRFFIELIGEVVNHVSFDSKTKKGKNTIGILLIVLLILLATLIFVIF